jgi:hypothetical protein
MGATRLRSMGATRLRSMGATRLRSMGATRLGARLRSRLRHAISIGATRSMAGKDDSECGPESTGQAASPCRRSAIRRRREPPRSRIPADGQLVSLWARMASRAAAGVSSQRPSGRVPSGQAAGPGTAAFAPAACRLAPDHLRVTRTHARARTRTQARARARTHAHTHMYTGGKRGERSRRAAPETGDFARTPSWHARDSSVTH